jgi:hypothetical protein
MARTLQLVVDSQTTQYQRALDKGDFLAKAYYLNLGNL